MDMTIIKLCCWIIFAAEILLTIFSDKICHNNKEIKKKLLGEIMLPFNFIILAFGMVFMLLHNEECQIANQVIVACLLISIGVMFWKAVEFYKMLKQHENKQ